MTHDLPPLPDPEYECQRESAIPMSYTDDQMHSYAIAAIAPYKAEIKRLKTLNQAIVDSFPAEENAKLRELLSDIRARLSNDYAPWKPYIKRIDIALGEKK